MTPDRRAHADAHDRPQATLVTERDNKSDFIAAYNARLAELPPPICVLDVRTGSKGPSPPLRRETLAACRSCCGLAGRRLPQGEANPSSTSVLQITKRCAI